MSAPLYTHPSLRPGNLVPVSMGNGDTAPVDSAEFHLRPSSSSSLSRSSCPCSPFQNSQIPNGDEHLCNSHGFNQAGVYQPSACSAENLPQFVASRRSSTTSNLAPFRELASENGAMQQGLHRAFVSSLPDLPVAASQSSLSNQSPRSSIHNCPSSQSQAHLQCLDQPCINENYIASKSSLDSTGSNASSPGQKKTAAPVNSSLPMGYPAHRHWQIPVHSSHYSRKPGGPGSVTSVSSQPLHHCMPHNHIASDYTLFTAPGHNQVTTAGSFTPESEHTRKQRYPTMNSDSALLKRRMNAREHFPHAKYANGSENVQEHMISSREQPTKTPLAANNLRARLKSPPGTTQGCHSSDSYLASHDRRNSASRMPMQSPCFFHQRFANAVNISQILNEIEADECFSHSRLVATATGVREVSRQLQRRQMKMEVKSVLIVTKARDNRLVYLTRELAEWLMSTPRYNNGKGNGLGVKVYVDSKLQKSRRFDAPGLIAKNPAFAQMLNYWTIDMCWACPEKFDLVLTLGGD
ncbi:NAD(+) kinase, partial [Ascosphaera aggregata]